jgi:hypothetical protein
MERGAPAVRREAARNNFLFATAFCIITFLHFCTPAFRQANIFIPRPQKLVKRYPSKKHKKPANFLPELRLRANGGDKRGRGGKGLSVAP